MSRRISKITAIGSCALVFVFIFAISIGAKTVESTNLNNPLSAKMKVLLDCTCECGLTLAYCEKEDADCSVRPALLAKLRQKKAIDFKGVKLYSTSSGLAVLLRLILMISLNVFFIIVFILFYLEKLLIN